ncbi:MAG: phosphatase PAP2 family protein [Sterolibacterium sp.]
MLANFRVFPILSAITLLFACQVTHAGNGSASDAASVALPLVAAGLSLYHDDGDGLWQLAKSEGATLVVTEVLKVSVREKRPNGQDNRSFPSRHASVAFSAAHFMQVRGGWAYGIPAYILAAGVAADRVHLREHYAKDVIAGAVVGIASSTYFTDKPYRVSMGYLPGDRAILAQLSMDW